MLIGLLLSFFFFLLFILTLSNNPSGDSLEFVLIIESNNHILLFDPYHVFTQPVGRQFFRLWQGLGWQNDPLLSLQILNALGGALSVGVMVLILQQLVEDKKISLLIATGFGISGAVWRFSIQAEFVTVPLLFLLLIIYYTMRLNARRIQRYHHALLLGILTMTAVGFYANSVFLIPVVLLGIFLLVDAPRPTRWRFSLVYLLSTAILLIIPAFFAIQSLNQFADPSLGGYTTGRFYAQFQPRDILHGGYAFLRSIALYPELWEFGGTAKYLAQATAKEKIIFTGYYLFIFVIALLPLLGAVLQRRQLINRYKREIGILGLLAVQYGLFAIYWVPGDLSFWVPLLAVWWIFTGLVLSTHQSENDRLYRWGMVAVLIVVILLLAMNFSFEIWPQQVAKI